MAGQNPLTASDYQSPDDIARVFAEGADTSISGSIDDGWDNLRDGLDVAAIAALLAMGGWIGVRRLISLEQITEAMRPTTTALVHLQNKVGAAAMADEVSAVVPAARPSVPFLPAQTTTQAPLYPTTGTVIPRPLIVPGGLPASGFMRPPPSVIPLTYDPIAPAQVAQQQAGQSAWLKRVADTVEAVIDQDIRQGMTNGMTADEIARTIKATIGLTPRQAAAVENFRRLLENGDAAALDRVLRDRRFDASVRRAIEGGKLDEDKIDRMVARYAERYQAHRAQVIARTETLRATNAGRAAAWAQFADRKGLDQSAIRKWWQTAHDERVCIICSAIPLMNPDGVPMGEFYATPDGPMMMPPEPHPSCRCSERFAITADAARGNA